MRNLMRYLGIVAPVVTAFFALKALVGWIQSIPSKTEHRTVAATAVPLPRPAESENEKLYSYRYVTRRIRLLGRWSIEVKTMMPEVKRFRPDPDMVKIEEIGKRIDEMMKKPKKWHFESMKLKADLKNQLDTVVAEQPE